MLVNFLKMMGFQTGKPVQSPAESISVQTHKRGIKSNDPHFKAAESDTPRAATARRQEVKPPSKTSKTAVKAKTEPKAASKSAPKTATKPVKTAAKPAVQAKEASKKVPVKTAKAVEKVKAKPVAAPVAAKKVSKPVTKAPAKSEKASTSAAKTAKVPTPKPSKATKAPEVKAPAKSAVKTEVKATEKAVSKAIAQETVKPAKMPAAPKAPKTPVAKPALVVQTAPAKTIKPGSRIVPSYVPNPANATPPGGNSAAKASFSVSIPVLAPPPQVVIQKDAKLVNNWKTKTAEQLSDAEVIAMPDAEYMNAKQLAFFRLKLVQLKTDILSNAGETTEHLREDTSVVPDPADRATIEEEHALELRTRDRERKLLKKIEQSISRIDTDEYGYCDETGEPIGVARLIARPTATLSLEAQQRRELKQKMFGD